jgi:hypothetical protein
MGRAKAFGVTLLYTVPMFLPALLYMGPTATNVLWIIAALVIPVIIYRGLRKYGAPWK